jgi:hypothetical protein
VTEQKDYHGQCEFCFHQLNLFMKYLLDSEMGTLLFILVKINNNVFNHRSNKTFHIVISNEKSFQNE